MIRMIRDTKQFPDSHEAFVSPDEVEMFRAGGWVPADPLDHDGDGKKGGARKKKDAAE